MIFELSSEVITAVEETVTRTHREYHTIQSSDSFMAGLRFMGAIGGTSRNPCAKCDEGLLVSLILIGIPVVRDTAFGIWGF